ncbi:hypothetical protein [Sorangium sp. So ce693]|uniref:hypothetical protein n=1 Tax=Sorangium sp. So ce693 TaxID=3133318 RepID=UPI003F644D80
MAIPLEMSRHLDAWVGTFPSAWWIYFRLRVRGYLSPGASGAAVRRIIREAISGGERSRREQLARLRAEGLTAKQAAQFAPPPGASWNTLVAPRLLEEHLLSSKGEEMARWLPWASR